MALSQHLNGRDDQTNLGSLPQLRSVRATANEAEGWCLRHNDNRGLIPASTRVNLDDLARLAESDIHHSSPSFRAPLQRDAEALARAFGPRGEPVLLDNIVTTKYLDLLLSAFNSAAPFLRRSWSVART